MATNFDRWEKDPFFSAAEEVQESADRMESNYRTWIHEAKLEASSSSCNDLDEIRRDLQTALGTAKWQLEEFERAVTLSYANNNSSKETQTRHFQFIDAISNQIATVENSLRETAVGEGKTGNFLPWVRLDEGERDELAQFLSGFTSVSLNNSPEKRQLEMVPDCSKSSCKSVEQDLEESKVDRLHGHRRTASAAEFTSWQVPVIDEESQRNTSDGKPAPSIPRIVSFSGFLSNMEPMTKIKSSKNGFRKWKLADRHQASDTLPLQSTQLTRGIGECYERSKSCLDGCDESYDKHLYGWLGSFQRQLQRSQYQIQYSRPVKVAMWASLATCMLVATNVLQLLRQGIGLNTTASVYRPTTAAEPEFSGSPTEKAILSWGVLETGMNIEQTKYNCSVLRVEAFNSEKKASVLQSPAAINELEFGASVYFLRLCTENVRDDTRVYCIGSRYACRGQLRWTNSGSWFNGSLTEV